MNNIEKFQFAEGHIKEIEDGYYQVGTLGGGYHFIELQIDEEGYICIMLHSGSRHLGSKICDYFHGVAREMNEKEGF